MAIDVALPAFRATSVVPACVPPVMVASGVSMAAPSFGDVTVILGGSWSRIQVTIGE